MKVYTARQPIFNAKRQVKAYELLFRNGIDNAFPNIDSAKATSKLIVDTHLNSGFSSLTGGLPALINFPESAILNDTATLLPKKEIVVEILENVTPSDEVYERCRKLFHQGYKLALDDFVFMYEWERFFPFVKLIKFDLRQTPTDAIEPLLPMLRAQKVKLLAEKVETYEEFAQCKALGFDFYQGYFFCRPEIIQDTDVPASQAFIMALYREVMKDDFKYSTLQKYFEKDVSLTYKLLRYVNSSMFSPNTEIESIKQALAYMGENRIRKFVCLIATAHLNNTKPSELIKLSILRARFCELVAHLFKLNTDHGFLTGLFSSIDAILDKSMDKVLENLPLSAEVKSGLQHKEGPFGILLNICEHYEMAKWVELEALCSDIDIDVQLLPKCYAEGIKWAALYDELN